jgi:hypothetical protein
MGTGLGRARDYRCRPGDWECDLCCFRCASSRFANSSRSGATSSRALGLTRGDVSDWFPTHLCTALIYTTKTFGLVRSSRTATGHSRS